MITTIFMTVFIFNLCGIIPGMNIAATASVVMPLAFALWVFVQYWRAGIKEHGLGGFLKEELLPRRSAVADLHHPDACAAA